MSTYDQLSMASRPVLYLSAPDVTDKSAAGLYALTSNNLVASGQPIIYGNPSSFYMTDTTTVTVTGNPLFFNDNSSLELVIHAAKPTQDVSIAADTAGYNSLVLDPTGITLRLFFESSASIYSKTVTIDINDWSKKFHITLSIGEHQAVLKLNDESVTLEYADQVVDSTDLIIGGGYSNYFYLIDGIGLYNTPVYNKNNVINDPGSGHSIYSAIKYNGDTTLFDGQSVGYIETLTLKDFVFTAAPDLYTLNYYVNSYDQGLDYISIQANDENVEISYLVNLDTLGTFFEYLLLDSVDDSVITLYFPAERVNDDFSLIIKGINSGNIETNSPANLVLDGMALIRLPAESIVNNPDGLLLPQALYTGTWTDSIPNTIEIVFKPITSTNDTTVFFSTDGQASFGPTGSITGYEAYLNGNLVTDLSLLKMDQWNHLVLVNDTPAATSFYLNSDDGSTTETISYMLLTAYGESLTALQILELYQILAGVDVIHVEESAVQLNEGMFDNGLPFNYYSYAWAIVGAGGS